MKSNTVILRSRPTGLPRLDNFAFVSEDVPAPGAGEVLLRTIWVSVDPYLRGKMSGTKVPRFELDKPISSKIIAEVVASNNPGIKKGDIVSHYLDWKEYQVSDGKGLVIVDAAAAPSSAYLSVLGVTGLSAYFALMDIGRPKPGETLVVSGAAGAVGSIAGQIGKIMGCRVVGIVGSEQKAALVKTKFGFDAAINYKSAVDIGAAIAAACPDGVDIYFDNVGGPISDAVIEHINPYGRIPVCGVISNYNDSEPATGLSLLPLVVYKFLTIQGFLIADFAPRFPEGIAKLRSWLAEGKLVYAETVVEGFEKLPEAFLGLFAGMNEGKMLVRV
jgi:NADPH:quinone reductase